MSKENLVEKLSEKYQFSKKQALEILNYIFDSIIESVRKGEDVKISGFGTFRLKVRKARTAVNPRTGEKIEVPEKKTPKFTPSKNFKEAVK